MASKDQNEWLTRVLGIAIPGGTADLKAAAERWRDASEAADAGIAKLQQALRTSDDAELKEISEYGINAVTGNYRVPLMAALRGAVVGNMQDAGKLAAAIRRFRDHLASDDRVEAVAVNPFDIQVNLRGTLIPALDELAACVPSM